MIVSQLMQSLLGNIRSSDNKILEFKVGDVVRGTVVKMLSQERAMLNINGSVIHAQLETPLKPGQVTMLQVQPESNQGLIVMRPLGSSQVQITADSLRALLQSFGMKNQPLERQLLQLMHQHGIVVNRQNVTTLAPLLTEMNEGMSSEQWIRAGILAMQRSLPLNVQTVHALHQVMFGASVAQLITDLQSLVQQALPASGHVEASGSIANQTTGQAGQPASGSVTIGQTGASSATVTGGQGGMPAIIQGHGDVQITASQHMNTDTSGQSLRSNIPGQGNMTLHSSIQSLEQSGTSHQTNVTTRVANATQQQGFATPATTATLLTQLGQQLTLLLASSQALHQVQGEQHTSHPDPQASTPPAVTAQQASAQAAATAQQMAAHASTLQQQPSATELGRHAALQPAMSQNSATSTSNSTAETSRPEQLQAGINQGGAVSSASDGSVQATERGNWITTILKLLGIDHEQRAIQHIRSEQLSGEAGRPVTTTMLDNVKSLLLQLQTATDLPQTLRDSAQSLLQHITGQQLLMTAERGSPFTHMTLFLPLYDEHGAQTAAINIQSRKGKKGGIDPENCRMVFDLSMSFLGQTLIDVQVMNNIVSIQVHNNHPNISEWLADGRSSMGDALLQMGFQLSSLTAKSLPEAEEAGPDAPEESQLGAAFGAMYEQVTYKGMDIRI